MPKVPQRLRPVRPFELTVNARANPENPTALLYESVLLSTDTRIASPHNSISDLRSFIHGVKITAAMLGYDIPEPTIPNLQDIDTAEINPHPQSS